MLVRIVRWKMVGPRMYKRDLDTGAVWLNLTGLEAYLAHMPPRDLEASARGGEEKSIHEWWAANYHIVHSADPREGPVISHAAAAIRISLVRQHF